MKKLSPFLVLFLLISSFSAQAQKYYVYDGTDFNIMFTSNNDNSDIVEISFTDENKTKWIKFEIIDWEYFEETTEGGFSYLVMDGKNDEYFIDYYRKSDYVEVRRNNGDDNFWTLYRRKE